MLGVAMDSHRAVHHPQLPHSSPAGVRDIRGRMPLPLHSDIVFHTLPKSFDVALRVRLCPF